MQNFKFNHEGELELAAAKWGLLLEVAVWTMLSGLILLLVVMKDSILTE